MPTKTTDEYLEVDVLVLGGGLAGCFASIKAAEKGVRVALFDIAARQQADLRLRQTEDGVLGGDAQVAGVGELRAAAQRTAVHRRDDGLVDLEAAQDRVGEGLRRREQLVIPVVLRLSRAGDERHREEGAALLVVTVFPPPPAPGTGTEETSAADSAELLREVESLRTRVATLETLVEKQAVELAR